MRIFNISSPETLNDLKKRLADIIDRNYASFIECRESYKIFENLVNGQNEKEVTEIATSSEISDLDEVRNKIDEIDGLSNKIEYSTVIAKLSGVFRLVEDGIRSNIARSIQKQKETYCLKIKSDLSNKNARYIIT